MLTERNCRLGDSFSAPGPTDCERAVEKAHRKSKLCLWSQLTFNSLFRTSFLRTSLLRTSVT